MSIIDGSNRLGGSTLGSERMRLLVCPSCGVRSMYAKKESGHDICPQCDFIVDLDEAVVETKVETLICETCSEPSPIIPQTRWELSDEVIAYCCKNHDCNRILSLQDEEGEIHTLEKVLKSEYVRPSSSQQSTEQIEITSVETQREEVVARVLNTEATDEDSSFRTYQSEHTRAFLAFVNGFAVGYLTWSPEPTQDMGDVAALRQIFVMKSCRRQGIASALIQHFKETIVEKYTCSTYIVEGANTSTLQVLRSLGEVDFTFDPKDGVSKVDVKDVCFTKTNPFRKLISESR